MNKILDLKQHILITGATGFIGKPLCNKLINDGHSLIVLTRNPTKAEQILSGNISFVSSLEAIQETIQIDVIINLAGEAVGKKWTAASKQKMLDSRINITNGIVALIDRLKIKPKVFINSSAIGYYGVDFNTVFTEDSQPSDNLIGQFPAQLCKRWESVANRASNYSVRTCNLRIGIVLEKNGGAIEKMLPVFSFGLGGRFGSGKQWFSWVHREDVINLIIFTINNSKISGAINVTAPNPVTNAQFTTALGKVLKRPVIFTIPKLIIKLIYGQMGHTMLLSGQKVLLKKALDNGFVFKYPYVSKALNNII